MSPAECAAKLVPLFSWVNVLAPQADFEAVQTEYGPMAFLGGLVPSPLGFAAACKRDHTLTAVLSPGATLDRVAAWKKYCLDVANILGAHAEEGLVVRDTFSTVHRETPEVELAAVGFRTDRAHVYGISWPAPTGGITAGNAVTTPIR